MSLTVACVWVQGNVDYDVQYVTKLRSMVARHLSQPFRFVCLTDRPQMLPSVVKVVTIAPYRGLFGWWSKIELFSSRHGFSGRMLYLDLDTLVVDDLTPIVDYPAPFALIPHAGTFNGKDGLSVVKRFNSSVMVWDAGSQDHIYNNFVPTKTPKRLWGDQDHIGEQCPFAALLPEEWFPRLSSLNGKQPDAPAKVVLAKKPKNEIAAQQWPWFREAWA